MNSLYVINLSVFCHFGDMASHSVSLIPAELAYDDNGLPKSPLFGDIYRPKAAPFEQAHHVFLRGNGLPGRWAGQELFTVCETGFGLGHNFLALWQAWRSHGDRCKRLHVVSFEAHPFRRHDLAAYVRHHLRDDAARLGLELADAWPVPVPGIHRLEFENGALTLTLVFGDVQDTARQVAAQVDAFFLDGFSPKVNPAMWDASLFAQLVRLAGPEATFATWCCAGHVRRALQDAGFIVQKIPGFGPKRQMTTGRLRHGVKTRVARARRPASAMVIGAGVAGASLAHALGREGVQVTVLDPVLRSGLGGSHAGHLAVAVTPVVGRNDDAQVRLSRAGVLSAAASWSMFPGPARPLPCGTLLPALTAADARKVSALIASASLPAEWVRWVPEAEAQALTARHWPHGGVWCSQGMRVQPQALLEHLLGLPGIRCLDHHVAGIRRNALGRWQALDGQGGVLADADSVFLATAGTLPALLEPLGYLKGFPRMADLRCVSGEVYYVPSSCIGPLQANAAGHGYCLPALDGHNVIGSTYRRGQDDVGLNPAGLRYVAGKMETLLGQAGGITARSLVTAGQAGKTACGGWSGWRATTSDRFPLVGALNPEMSFWVCAGLGSRGFGLSTLLANCVVAELMGYPVPLERDLRRKMRPR
ncbi:MAG: tRNA (5-methylaminomethyl-2-thiouridine)(34)-methyltransferase MnmD [Burkholderiaceae bacterium]